MKVGAADIFQPVVADIKHCTAHKLRSLSRRVTQIYDEALSLHGLTIGQLGILNVLSSTQGISVTLLAKQVAVDASALSRLIKPLVAAGLASIEANPNDRRAKMLRLTNEGIVRVSAANIAHGTAQSFMQNLLGTTRMTALHHILDDSFALL